jgi:hypothetical protein
MAREIFAGQPLEPPIAEDGTEARVILAETIAKAKPVLTVVNLQPIERSQPVVWVV